MDIFAALRLDGLRLLDVGFVQRQLLRWCSRGRSFVLCGFRLFRRFARGLGTSSNGLNRGGLLLASRRGNRFFGTPPMGGVGCPLVGLLAWFLWFSHVSVSLDFACL